MSKHLWVSDELHSAVESVISAAKNQAIEEYKDSQEYWNAVNAAVAKEISDIDPFFSLSKEGHALELVLLDTEGTSLKRIDLEALLPGEITQFDTPQIIEILQSLERIASVCRAQLDAGSAA